MNKSNGHDKPKHRGRSKPSSEEPQDPQDPRWDCGLSRADSERARLSCDALAHYHMEHSGDKITRWRAPYDSQSRPNSRVHIYVTGDPEWMEKLEKLTASSLKEGWVPDEDRESGKPE